MNTKRLVMILGLAGFIVMADNWVVSPILPAIAESFDVDPARAGILIAAYMLPFGLFQLVFGPLADHFGKLRVIMSTMVFFSLATALCGLGMGLTDFKYLPCLDWPFCRRNHARIARINRRCRPAGKPSNRNWHLYGNRFFGTGALHGYRWHNCLFR